MIDFVILTKEISGLENVFNEVHQPLRIFNLTFDLVIKNSIIIKYVSFYRGLRFTIQGETLTIQNSLCKFYHGYNHLNFYFWELLKTKSLLEELLGINLNDAKIRVMEYGAVIKVSKPELVYNSLGVYKNRMPQDMSYKGKIYGKCYENSTHKLKIYDKTLEAKRNGFNFSEGLLRIEKKVSLSHLNSSPRFKNNQISTFSDICRRSTFQLLGEDLVKSLNLIELTDVVFYLKGLTIKDLRLLGYMGNYSIRKLIKTNHIKSYESDKKRYLEIIKDRNENNKDNFIIKVVQILEKIYY